MTKEEAIKILSEKYSNALFSERTALETLISELKEESEDERIRKAILEFFKLQDDNTTYSFIPKKSILAWLEKPKDAFGNRAQNITANMLKDRIEGIQRELIEFLSNTINASWVDIIKSADCYAQRIRSILEKQKEQKPINNSTREKIISRATSEKQVVLISESSGEAEISWDTRSLEDAKKLLECGLAFINRNIINHAEKQKEQKPAEWSEEDEKMLRLCENRIMGTGTFVPTRAGLYDMVSWLKSLRPQPKQEWSVEDERMLRLIINAFKNGAMSTIGQEQWLKSLPERFNLQPQTQPKQEQNSGAKLTGWIARDRECDRYFRLGLILFMEGKPQRSADNCWNGKIALQLPWESFPDLKWEDEPVEVEITIRKK